MCDRIQFGTRKCKPASTKRVSCSLESDLCVFVTETRQHLCSTRRYRNMPDPKVPRVLQESLRATLLRSQEQRSSRIQSACRELSGNVQQRLTALEGDLNQSCRDVEGSFGAEVQQIVQRLTRSMEAAEEWRRQRIETTSNLERRISDVIAKGHEVAARIQRDRESLETRKRSREQELIDSEATIRRRAAEKLGELQETLAA